MSKSMLLEMSDNGVDFGFNSLIESALNQANMELDELNEQIDSIEKLKSDCDKIDYLLAIGSGTLCGLIDIFLVGKPGDSPLGEITDKWFENRTQDFAKLCDWQKKENSSTTSAIKFLENRFKVPYDQRGAGDSGSMIYQLSPMNHHFKSLAHNPSLLGLFFSILDQFNNTSHFVSDSELLSLSNAKEGFRLQGDSIPSKLFCAFVNWFGHLISDVSGASGSKSRGMGIPSPLWTWTNDIIAIKKKLKIPVFEFDKSMNELAVQLYTKGYDIRFQTAQAIPVFINEMIVRLLYSIRRLVKYFSETDKYHRSFAGLWEKCEPFSNPTVKRMLTVAHGTFCLIDLGDATVRSFVEGGGAFQPVEFFLRVNIVGAGRFTVSLYGEAKRQIAYNREKKENALVMRERLVVENYIDGLKILSEKYDDHYLISFVEDLKASDMYVEAFGKSKKLAEKRLVPENKILRTKEDIDYYFGGNK